MSLAGLSFEVQVSNIHEEYPTELALEEIPVYLAKQKAQHLHMPANTVLIAADTVVILHNQVLGKPQDRNQAISMLKDLSGQKHKVITGVCMLAESKEVCFAETTFVQFKELSQNEIEYYVDNFAPYDKAGAYGIQEWIGLIGIERIEGDYFNVMGLPIRRIYEELKRF